MGELSVYDYPMLCQSGRSEAWQPARMGLKVAICLLYYFTYISMDTPPPRIANDYLAYTYRLQAHPYTNATYERLHFSAAANIASKHPFSLPLYYHDWP